MHALKKLLGPGIVFDDNAHKGAYSLDGSGKHLVPELVIRPHTTHHILSTIKYCKRTNTDVVVRGGGTNIVGSAIGTQSVVVDMKQWDNIIKLDLRKQLVTVQPGVTYEQLATFLAKEKMWFPIQPPNPKTATLGGMFSMNTTGLKAYRYGRIDRWVEEIELIDGTGKYYTLKKPHQYAGQEGTLGIIISLTLRITPPLPSVVTQESYQDIPTTLSAVKKLLHDEHLVGLYYVNKHAAGPAKLGDNNHLLLIERDGESVSKEYLQQYITIPYQLMKENNIQLIDATSDYEQLYDLLQYTLDNNIPCWGPLGIKSLYVAVTDKTSRDVQELILRKGLRKGLLTGYGRKNTLPPNTKKRFIKLKEEHDYHNIMGKEILFSFK